MLDYGPEYFVVCIYRFGYDQELVVKYRVCIVEPSEHLHNVVIRTMWLPVVQYCNQPRLFKGHSNENDILVKYTTLVFRRCRMLQIKCCLLETQPFPVKRIFQDDIQAPWTRDQMALPMTAWWNYKTAEHVLVLCGVLCYSYKNKHYVRTVNHS